MSGSAPLLRPTCLPIPQRRTENDLLSGSHRSGKVYSGRPFPSNPQSTVLVRFPFRPSLLVIGVMASALTAPPAMVREGSGPAPPGQPLGAFAQYVHQRRRSLASSMTANEGLIPSVAPVRRPRAKSARPATTVRKPQPPSSAPPIFGTSPPHR